MTGDLIVENEILTTVGKYYSSRIIKHGPTPAGVDWNGQESQLLRFELLCGLIRGKDVVSINDFGCGYGKLADFLTEKFPNIRYFGYDLSQQMIDSAVQQNYALSDVSFIKINLPHEMFSSDYTVASGIFNVKMEYSEDQWLSYILSTLDVMNEKSRLGFAFNLLTKYSDSDYMKNKLYYADPCFLFDYCKRNYSKNVALLHDYDLYEFTIRVLK